jgi:uncharacterized protein YbaR (Trm112 family)
MTRLACPHCAKPIAANPIGRWYRPFQCPHCRGALQFDAFTNALGIGGSALFFVMVYALVMGTGEKAHLLALASGLLWVLSLAASYAFRRVVKGDAAR